MEKISFGSLKDWGVVLDKLESLVKSRDLSHYQDELIHMLRFNQNWRLREAAIESLAAVDNPSGALFKEVFSLMMRNNLYYDVRILAADGLEKLTANVVKTKTFDHDALKKIITDIVQGMENLLASPEPPKFHNALRHSMEQIRSIADRYQLIG